MNDGANKYAIPMLPLPGWRSFGAGRGGRIPSIEDSGALCLVTSGRVAIGLALGKLGVGPGDQVLLPAYHCPSMVEPIPWLGAEPVFYKIHPDTSPDLDDIRDKISAKTRVVLAAHFFGRVQDFGPLQSICRDNRIGLIEDCAHAFFGEAAGVPVGGFGDIAIASLRKFFPLFDGGCLLSTTLDLNDVSVAGLGFRYEAKALLDTIGEAVRFGRLPLFKPLIYGLRYLSGGASGAVVADDDSSSLEAHEPGSGEYRDPRYRRESLHGRMSVTSRMIFSAASTNRIIRERVANYRFLARELASLSRGRPLFDEVSATMVPYVFPLIIDDPDRAHAALRRAGVAMWRWEHIQSDICPISNSYSRSVIQLPCHQELKQAELSRMVRAIRGVL